MDKLYMVWFEDEADAVFFVTYKEAEHYARMNAGNVRDVDTWETIARFS